jgi:hypothetical protein
LLAQGAAVAAPTVKPPTKKHTSAFAIIVDSETYNRIGKAVDRYRDAVETDGLSAYIVIGEWKRPEEVRHSILDLADKQPPLEGVVLIGDIPPHDPRRPTSDLGFQDGSGQSQAFSDD